MIRRTFSGRSFPQVPRRPALVRPPTATRQHFNPSAPTSARLRVHRSARLLVYAPRAALILFLLFTGCATPIPPSGGPPDEIPPELAETVPSQGAVNFDEESIRFTFSEYVDPSSFAQAFSISPAFSRPLDFNWSGRSVVIRFPEPLRENTTYVLTLDTNLRDIHRVALSSPIVYAFSTGPTISAGTLTGRVVAVANGAPVAGMDVLAYALADSTAPDSLPPSPAYRTQTDDEGTFRYEYLTQQFYFVPALRDGNRNLNPDPQEPYAAPPWPALFADSLSSISARPWVVSAIDTTSPAPVRAQSAARSRHLVRFSEPIQFLERDPAAWTVTDSVTGAAVDVRTLYILQSETREVHVITRDLEDGRYGIMPGGVVDTSGNAVVSQAVFFTPAAQDDTLHTRFVSFLPAGVPAGDGAPETTLPRGVEPGIRFTRPISEDLLSAAVSIADSMDVARAFAAVTQNGTDYDILPDPPLRPSDRISVAVDASQLSGPDTTYVRNYRRISADETGEIAGVVQTVATTKDTTLVAPPRGPLIVEVHPADVPIFVPTYTAIADTAGAFRVPGLPAGSYRLRAFADADSSGAWDPGLLIPYQPAEGITWRTEPVRVRSRWETALPDTMRIQIPR